jgi:hypothetical protein
MDGRSFSGRPSLITSEERHGAETDEPEMTDRRARRVPPGTRSCSSHPKQRVHDSCVASLAIEIRVE